MGRPRRVGDLDITVDDRFQTAEWKLKRVGWVVLGLVLVGALLGLFGEGPLSTTRRSDGPLRVRYDRFGRWEAPTEIEVQLDRDAAVHGQVELRLIGGLATDWDVEDVRPPPDGTALVDGGVVYRFPLASGPTVVSFELEPQRFGALSGSIAVADRRVAVHQWIFP